MLLVCGNDEFCHWISSYGWPWATVAQHMILESWVFWSLLAAVMQSIRTAIQKHLTAQISAEAATLVRYLFGLPFVLVYLWWLLDGQPLPGLNWVFAICVVLAGIFQVIATVLLVRLFTLRNFAVGSTYVRGEIVVTAILGAILFGEIVSLLAALGILICSVGLVLISMKAGKLSSLWNRSAAYGLGAAVTFSLTSLLIRQGSLSLGLEGAMLPAAMTLAFMVVFQTLISLVMVSVRDAGEIRTVLRLWRPGFLVGITSVAGSAGWFTAFTLENAAYVKTLGQVEFLITLAISTLIFREKPTPNELIAMLFIIGGVIVLLMSP